MKKTKKIYNKLFVKKQFNKSDTDLTSLNNIPSWEVILTGHPGAAQNTDFRIKMTSSCRDTDYISKVKDAGKTVSIKGQKYQTMHNGILVESGGYFGDWMADIIKNLNGHHEPQEEKLFYEILKLLPPKSVMIELGSYWAYYSIWFNKTIEDAVNFCCEPDPENLQLGQRNAKVNEIEGMNFLQSAAGSSNGKTISFKPQEGDRDPVEVPIRSIDSIVAENLLKNVEIVHMDVQGVELLALEGAEKSIKEGKIRFLFISTHHYLISGDITIHEKCIAKIKGWGGLIITEHAVHESFSGDGLILASFNKIDKNIKIDVSINRLQSNLFRSYAEDLKILSEEYEKLRLLKNNT